MSDSLDFNTATKPKSFWQRPEGVTGLIFLLAILAGGGYLLVTYMDTLLLWAQNTLYLVGMLMVLAAIVYVIIDPRMRNLIGYAYRSVMRTLTGWFVTIDPIGVLKNYVEDLEKNLGKMRKQIGVLKGQMRKIKSLIDSNAEEIEQNMKMAQAARNQGKEKQQLLSSRKAARLKESNEKYAILYKRMEVLYRILSKMHTNSEILLEDTKDQVKHKEQERKAIRTAHGAMKSAMSVISGDPDKRAMFDMAMEAIADDVANKVGEMERFMEMSSDFMESVDLQNGIFEEEGLKMLEEWEQKSTLMLLQGSSTSMDTLDLDSSPGHLEDRARPTNNSEYDNLFG